MHKAFALVLGMSFAPLAAAEQEDDWAHPLCRHGWETIHVHASSGCPEMPGTEVEQIARGELTFARLKKEEGLLFLQGKAPALGVNVRGDDEGHLRLFGVTTGWFWAHSRSNASGKRMVFITTQLAEVTTIESVDDLFKDAEQGSSFLFGAASASELREGLEEGVRTAVRDVLDPYVAANLACGTKT